MKNNKNKIINRIQLVLFALVVIITIGLFLIYLWLMYKDNKKPAESKYTAHYSFVVEDLSDEFLEAVYSEVCNEALEKGIYVEKVGAGLSGKYTLAQKLQIAIATDPEGIIIKADDSPEVKELIDEAVDKGIVVATIVTDIQGSKRQSFVGPNYYDLGKAYGEQLKSIGYKNEYNVALLMNDNMPESNRNSLYQGIIEAANSENSYCNLKIVNINYENNITIEEDIRNTILGDTDNYDVLVCTDQLTTAYSYQALVDYNKIGQMSVLGFYDTEIILNGVMNGNLQSVIFIDPKEVAEYATDSIYDYAEYGYSSYYLPVNIEVINADNANEYIKKEADED